jgi:L-amino acid N-acyltransferase YncA
MKTLSKFSPFNLSSTYQDEPQPIIRKATESDLPQIYTLYKTVASTNPGSLTQQVDEITLAYVQEMLTKGRERGLVLVLEQNSHLIGYLKAFTSKYRCLASVLTNTTMMIHPEWQGKGYGSQLMQAYLREIQRLLLHLKRFEVFPHHSNRKAIDFYLKHGFSIESVSEQKILNFSGNLESELTMVWFNPNFSSHSLHQYQLFLAKLHK